ncbi:MAG: hypothetical protein ABIO57_03770 [Candidatus Paceibacterota bacterium]
MKKFELTVTRGGIKIYKAVFCFTKEQEKDLFKKIGAISKQGKFAGIDTSDVDNNTATNPDLVIMATLRAQCQPLVDGILAFEKNMKNWGKLVTITTSNLGEVLWDCKRIHHLEVVS